MRVEVNNARVTEGKRDMRYVESDVTGNLRQFY